jgi:2-polyprenyl-6-methoxyphenol hydroxylase-like FAD-dependent oxidoreductase
MRSEARERSRADVVILGGGVAAAATAIALTRSGIRPMLLVLARPMLLMTEAIPASAISLLDALGLSAVVQPISTVARELQNLSHPRNPIIRNDPFILLDRVELAARMIEHARTLGAVVEQITRVPPLRAATNAMQVAVGGSDHQFAFAVDASGRAAKWSQPVGRIRHVIADIFEGPAIASPAGLRLIRYDDGWAYRVCLRTHTTVALLSSGRPRHRDFPAQLAHGLEVPLAGFRLIGRRVAYVQWAGEPVRGRLISVGDAALAHDPVSGQGIRFALGSALAAAAVIRTGYRSCGESSTSARFYAEFVATERDRHRAFLPSFYGRAFAANFESNPSQPEGIALATPLPYPSTMPSGNVRFAAKVEMASLHVDGFIEVGEVIRLNHDGAVRWLGGFDLLRLRELATAAVSIGELVARLIADGIPADRSIAIIQWCRTREILVPIVP